MRQIPRNDRERLEQGVGGLLSNLRELVRALEETDDLQWRKPRAGNDKTHSGVSDPTGATVVDYERLRMRQVRKDVLRELEAWEASSARLLQRMNEAAEPYEGGDNGTA